MNEQFSQEGKEKAEEDAYYQKMLDKIDAIKKKIESFEQTTGIPITTDGQIQSVINASAILGTGKDPISKILSKILLKIAEFVKMTGQNEAYFRFLFSAPKQYRESLVPVKEEKIQEVRESIEEYTGRSFTKEDPLSYANRLSSACADAFIGNTKDLLKESGRQIVDHNVKNVSSADIKDIKSDLHNMLVNTFVESYNSTMKDLQLHPDKAQNFFKTISKNIEKMGLDIGQGPTLNIGGK